MRKVVIIGRAASGKTNIIQELEKRGYKVLREVAREVISKLKTISTEKRAVEERQRLIFDLNLRKEERFDRENPKEDILFCDRSLIDGLGYSYLFLGEVPFEVTVNLKERYEKIFLLEGLPFQKDENRIENDDDDANKIIDAILDVYKKFEYKVIHVPIFEVGEKGIKKRVDFILENCKL